MTHTRLGRRRRLLWSVGGLALAALLGTACTSGEPSSSSTSNAPATTAAPGETPTGPSPGVTDDTIKIGVTYPDAAALQAIGLTFDFGDVEGAYQALADAINEDGGVAGRQLELVFAPIDPTSPAPAEQACLELTEDQDVFLITGFFLDDAVLCPVAQHETAVVGGQMTEDRLSRAVAPWITVDADPQTQSDGINTLIEEGTLDGTVAVMARAEESDDLDNVVAALEEAGIEPVETALLDAPADDQAAVEANMRTISERFQSADADQVLLVGGGGTNWLGVLEGDTSYTPELRFTDLASVTAFAASAATTDLSALEGSAAVGGYGDEQAVFDEPKMSECVGRIEDQGVDVPSPDEVDSDDPSVLPYSGAVLACGNLTLTQAWLDAAGEDLNYGTLQAALDAGFDVASPGEPEDRTYGPPPDADGNPTGYLYVWDADAGPAGEMVLQGG